MVLGLWLLAIDDCTLQNNESRATTDGVVALANTGVWAESTELVLEIEDGADGEFLASEDAAPYKKLKEYVERKQVVLKDKVEVEFRKSVDEHLSTFSSMLQRAVATPEQPLDPKSTEIVGSVDVTGPLTRFMNKLHPY